MINESSRETIPYYAIFDQKVGLWALPIPAQNHDDAIRAFTGQVNSPDSRLHMFSEDFSLWHVGEFDQEAGVLIGPGQPEHLVTAVTVKRPIAAQEEAE